MARARQQFPALHPRRIILPKQVDGAELDLDALIAARVATRDSCHAPKPDRTCQCPGVGVSTPDPATTNRAG